jgi:hypothetical protein
MILSRKSDEAIIDSYINLINIINIRPFQIINTDDAEIEEKKNLDFIEVIK